MSDKWVKIDLDGVDFRVAPAWNFTEWKEEIDVIRFWIHFGTEEECEKQAILAEATNMPRVYANLLHSAVLMALEQLLKKSAKKYLNEFKPDEVIDKYIQAYWLDTILLNALIQEHLTVAFAKADLSGKQKIISDLMEKDLLPK